MNPVAQYVAQYLPLGRTALLLAVAASSAAGGAWLCGLVKTAELSDLRRTHAEQLARAEGNARLRLQAALDHGNALTEQLHTANRAALHNQERLDEALSRVTTGRRCLNAAALRLLDGAKTPATADVPAATRGAAAAHGAATPDTPDVGDPDEWASDTHVAHWANLARTRYDECRRRLDAVRAFHQPVSTTGVSQ